MSESPQDPGSKPPRRVRYKGTHPRQFHEKYKELNPEKYTQDMEKVKSRGSTPVGTHIPICVKEILEILKPQAGKVFVDATLGYGGHSSQILSAVAPNGKLVVFDQDPIERPKTVERLKILMSSLSMSEDNLIVGAINFSNAWGFLRQAGLAKVDGVLADLGLSSMQIDTPERGFSFKVAAPFDLRMNPQKGEPAFEVLKSLSEEELTAMLQENSDEPHAKQIAQQLLKDLPETTNGVADSVRKAMARWSKNVQEKEGDTPIRRVFQALRIFVNQEYDVLDRFLEELPHFLKSGARVAILTFHSGEDRRVKKSFQFYQRSGVYSQVSDEPLRPSQQEQRDNPRSKSAKLRWAQKS